MTRELIPFGTVRDGLQEHREKVAEKMVKDINASVIFARIPEWAKRKAAKCVGYRPHQGEKEKARRLKQMAKLNGSTPNQ